MLKRLLEIKKRKTELSAELNTLTGEKLDEAIKEVDSLNAEEQDINKRMAEAEQVEKRGHAIMKPVEQKEEQQQEFTIDSKEYRNAYLKFLQGKDLSDIEQRAMTTASNSAGAVIPTLTMNKIVEKLENEGVILPLVTRLNIPSNVTIPVENTTNDVEWVAEGGSNDVSDTLTPLSLKAYELIKTVDITAQVAEMSIDAFESFLVNALARKTKVAIDDGIINGAGAGSNTATGIVTAIGSDAIETGANTGYAYDDVMEIIKNLKAGYRQGATFVISTNTLYGEIAKIKDGNGQPIFKFETDGRFEGRLSGYPVVCYDNLADGKVIFGNFEYYYFNFVKPFEVAKDTSVGFKTAKTCYRALALADGNVALKEAFVVMGKNSNPSRLNTNSRRVARSS